MQIVSQMKAPTHIGVRAHSRRPSHALVVFLALLLTFAGALVWAFAQAIDTWTWVVWAVLPLIAANALWISGGAATAILGLIVPASKEPGASPSWTPSHKTAVLITLCGEDPTQVARYIDDLHKGMVGTGLDATTRIFILSDTFGQDLSAREEAALANLISADHVHYRRRINRTGKKPGNIADWLDTHGNSFDHMVVLDADSRMTAASIRHLIWRLELNPNLGLCQAGISLIPGRSRFGQYQRVAARLLSKTFGKGFAAWSGKSGNYWGHNAIIRIDAFRCAAALPTLSGPAPFGGMILSHDFIEAAWIRRAGWDVELCPGIVGSAEDAPQTMGEYFKRDRRWCQGNLQHLRLIAVPGLHPISRYHLMTGIFSYLAAPIWLLLFGLMSTGLISIWGFLPILAVAAVLLIPKLCALIDTLPKLRTARRWRIVLRAWGVELVLSTMLAPLIMLRQAACVAAVLLGRDCGWKSPQTSARRIRAGWPEAALGLAIATFAIVNATPGAFWMALVIIPLLSAPVLMPKLNEAP